MEEIGGIEKREQKRIDKDKDGTETTTMDDNHTYEPEYFTFSKPYIYLRFD